MHHGRLPAKAGANQAADRVTLRTGRRPSLRARHSALIEIVCLESEQVHLLNVPRDHADTIIGRMLAAAGAALEEFSFLGYTHAAARGRAGTPPRVGPGAGPASAAGTAAPRVAHARGRPAHSPTSEVRGRKSEVKGRNTR